MIDVVLFCIQFDLRIFELGSYEECMSKKERIIMEIREIVDIMNLEEILC